jgi:SAM-dependent methyltransferase
VRADEAPAGAPSTQPCRICGGAVGNRLLVVREMMYGTRESFPYLLCGSCGCLQIAEVPSDLARHYAHHYYSFLAPPDYAAKAWPRRTLLRWRDEYAVFGGGGIGRWLYRGRPCPELRSLSLVPGLRRDQRILDVGAGAGKLLRTLRARGFTNLLGVDPYLERDVDHPDGLRILKRGLEDVAGLWDLIMFHHVFEHMADPVAVLRLATACLAPGGRVLIRIPLVSSWAFREYGVHWVQLDAPRHLFLHSPESLTRVAAAAGLGVREVVWDSTAFQFWGSEQYARDIPLRAADSYATNPARSPFTPRDIAAFARRAAELNRARAGDQAAFILAR